MPFQKGNKLGELRKNIDRNVTVRTSSRAALYERVCRGCGRKSLVAKRDLRNQCRACAIQDRCGTHGLTSHPLYRVIKSAEARCKYPAVKDYKHYGGRGISVCQEWSSDPSLFIRWALANGWRRGLELDRRNNDGNYSPDNCRFVTHQENCANRRRQSRRE